MTRRQRERVQPVSLSLAPGVRARLEELAQRTFRSKSAVVALLLMNADMEDLRGLKERDGTES